MRCENCNHDIVEKYGSGRFCSQKCSRSYSTKLRRSEISEKISKTFESKRVRIQKTCPICNKTFHVSHKRRNQKSCSKECGAKLGNSYSHKRETLSIKRCESISKGVQTGSGIRSIFNGIKCDSALEFCFLKWYTLSHPEAKIKRCDFVIEKYDIRYVPDFIIDDKIIVEVKFSKRKSGGLVHSRIAGSYNEGKNHIKLMILKEHGDYIWFTDEICGQKFYKQALKEAKQSIAR